MFVFLHTWLYAPCDAIAGALHRVCGLLQDGLLAVRLDSRRGLVGGGLAAVRLVSTPARLA